MSSPEVSIIVRTKNELYWLGQCLEKVYQQNFKDFELIVVDNSKNTQTKNFIKKNYPNIKIIKYKDKFFFPGKALNLGIKNSKGKYVAIISGHCVPKDKFWLGNLLKNIKNKKNIAGVYGKQEPIENSNFRDIIDLSYLFGNDKKYQSKDPFFHNANSIIQKTLWIKKNFDNKIKHIEDRIWAQYFQLKGFKIVYEPKASVFHHHGVFHHNNLERTKKISEIVKPVVTTNKKPYIICVIPIKDPLQFKSGEYLIEKPISEILKINYVKKIIIICNDKNLKKKLSNKNIIFFNRDKKLDIFYLGINYFLLQTYKKYFSKFKCTHILFFLDCYYSRPKLFFRNLIRKENLKYDAVFPFCELKNNSIWKKRNGNFEKVYSTSIPTKLNKYPFFIQLKGVGSLISISSFLISGIEVENYRPIIIDYNSSIKFSKEIINNINDS